MTTFVEAAHPRARSGEFAAKPQSNPELTLETGQVPLATTGGAVAVSPGAFDSQARQAFLDGQAVAFAAAYARRSGAEEIRVVIDTRDDSVIHAFVERGALDIVDADGVRDFDRWVADASLNETYGEDGWAVRSIPVAETIDFASSEYALRLPHQDFWLAETMMDEFEAVVEDSAPRLD